MSAAIIPFPPARRLLLVASIARRTFDLRPDADEQHIRRSVDVQANVMRRKCIAEELIHREAVNLDAAVRALLQTEVTSRPQGRR
jgi:hypothetical protein